MKQLLSFLQKYGILVGFLIFCIYIDRASPGNVFHTKDNLLNVARQISINTMLGIGMTFVILTAGIDLSVGSMLALSGVLAAKCAFTGHGLPLSFAAGMAAGAFLGFCNGLVITRLRIVPFIATLAMMIIARGGALLYTQAVPVSPLPDGYRALGAGYAGPVPIPVLVMIVVISVSLFILTQTAIGRYVYAIGGNEAAARLSGVNVDRVKLFVYTLSGCLAGIGSVVLTSRLGSGDPKLGELYELNAIAAVVLGGTSLSGGKGGIPGTVLGAMIMGVLDNGLNLLNVPSFNQYIVKGFVILAAVYLDSLKENK